MFCLACFANAPVFAALFSLCGSIMLVFPAWRASQLMKASFQLSGTLKTEARKKKQAEEFSEAVGKLAEDLEKEAVKWTPCQHRLLIGGIGAMVIGGGLALIDAGCKAGGCG